MRCKSGGCGLDEAVGRKGDFASVRDGGGRPGEGMEWVQGMGKDEM